ncbi:TonB-dependent receptor [Aquimarina sp. U1-2]|uniref:TonB-dependent receptor n=1 Tax=Aquimarina sp. U1-2 TaxID=2823141 RepID=UPI001AECF19F|nr:TonB-dependent receptor [Aquimarina sp. U1-2]MBP2834251.1 TonB-dependent receptor [Aquimarina sp. U1-2]
MKYILIIIAIIFSTAFAKAQSTITGIVTDDTGIQLETASVILQGTNQGTVTDKEGRFTLRNVMDGTYTLEVSYIGFADFIKVITIEGNNISINITLTESAEALQLVEVVGRKNTDYKPDVTFASTKTGADIKLVPQSIAILNKEIIADQGLFRLEEVSENVAGVTRTRFGDNFTSRGFRVRHDFINGNRALLAPDFSASSIATQYERIEFIKGPAAALFGNSSPGGVVNAVTKKPLKEHRADASLSYGSFETKRGTLDVTGPLDEDKTVLYRVNVGWENAETFRDFQKNRSILFAPSLSYLPSDKTSFNVDIVGTFNNDDAGVDRGMPVLQGDIFALPINFSTAEPFDNRQNSSVLLTVSGSHKFSDVLSLNASYTRSDFNQNFVETRSSNEFTEDGSELIRNVNDRITKGYSDFITAYLVGKFNTGTISHETVLGWDYYSTFTNIYTKSANGEANGVPNLVFDNRTIYNSLSEVDLSFEIDREFSTEEQYRGLYVQDLMSIWKLKILVGLRYENLDQLGEVPAVSEAVDNVIWLPRAGITYELNEHVNLFFSYTESFNPQFTRGLAGITIEPNQTFDPLVSNQFEIGTKTSFFNDKLLTQLSLYTISREGRIIQDPTVTGGLERLIQVGEEISRGVEFEATGRINTNFTLTANYAFNEVEILDDNAAVTQLELQNNNPQHTAGFWGKYTFTKGAFKDLGLALGARHVSESQIPAGTANAVSPFVEFPAYTTARAALFYRWNNINLTCNLNNIFDERYFVGGLDAGRVFPGIPRNVLLTIGYSF